MTTTASTLLEFILDLLRDPAAAKAFERDPEGALADAGLTGVTPADVQAVMPAMADSSPMAYAGARHHGGRDEDDDSHGPAPKPVRDEDCDKPVKDDGDKDDDGHWHKVWHEDDCTDDQDHGGGHGGGHDVAAVSHVRHVEHTYVQNNYVHTDVDVEIERAIWVGGDAQAIFGNGNAVAGDNSVVLGEDAEVEVDIEDSFDVEDSFDADNSTTTTSTTTISNSGNTDSPVADRGGVVEDNDTTVDVDIEDSLNGNAGGDITHVDAEHSFNGNAGRDITTTETDVHIEDSLNGNAGRDVNNTDVEVEDSFNQETDVEIDDSFNRTETEVDVEIDDSFDETDNSVQVEDSFNPETEFDVDIDESFNESSETEVEDSAFVVIEPEPAA